MSAIVDLPEVAWSVRQLGLGLGESGHWCICSEMALCPRCVSSPKPRFRIRSEWRQCGLRPRHLEPTVKVRCGPITSMCRSNANCPIHLLPPSLPGQKAQIVQADRRRLAPAGQWLQHPQCQIGLHLIKNHGPRTTDLELWP